MMGGEGVPSIVSKLELLKLFRCDWLTLHDIPQSDYLEGIIYLETRNEIEKAMEADAKRK